MNSNRIIRRPLVTEKSTMMREEGTNILAFEVDQAEEIHRRITAANVTLDRRGQRLRVGVGVYHDEAEVQRLVATLARVTMAP